MPLEQNLGMDCILEEVVDKLQRRAQQQAADEVVVMDLEYITIDRNIIHVIVDL